MTEVHLAYTFPIVLQQLNRSTEPMNPESVRSVYLPYRATMRFHAVVSILHFIFRLSTGECIDRDLLRTAYLLFTVLYSIFSNGLGSGNISFCQSIKTFLTLSKTVVLSLITWSLIAMNGLWSSLTFHASQPSNPTSIVISMKELPVEPAFRVSPSGPIRIAIFAYRRYKHTAATDVR